MEFFEVVRRRRSVRKYEGREVEEEKIKTILEHTILCQTAGNLQSYRIYVVKRKEVIEKLAVTAYGQMFIAQAPVVFVVTADREKAYRVYGRRGYELYAVNDASIVATYIELCACALGLATCWVGAFDEEAVRKILGIESEHEKPIAIIPCGYPAEKPVKPEKRRDVIKWIC